MSSLRVDDTACRVGEVLLNDKLGFFSKGRRRRRNWKRGGQ